MSAGPPWSRTMKQASVSATDQGGGKRRRSVTRPDNAPRFEPLADEPGRHGSHAEVQEQTAARGGPLAVKLNAHVAPIVAGHTRH